MLWTQLHPAKESPVAQVWASLTRTASCRRMGHGDEFWCRFLQYLDDRINTLAISWFHMEHLGNFALLFSFWNIIKQCSEALCARGKMPGHAITLSMMCIRATWFPYSSFFPSQFYTHWAGCLESEGPSPGLATCQLSAIFPTSLKNFRPFFPFFQIWS